MLSHKTTPNKFQQISEAINYIKHFLQPQLYETRNQLQEKYKQMETKHHATEKPMGQCRHQI